MCITSVTHELASCTVEDDLVIWAGTGLKLNCTEPCSDGNATGTVTLRAKSTWKSAFMSALCIATMRLDYLVAKMTLIYVK